MEAARAQNDRARTIHQTFVSSKIATRELLDQALLGCQALHGLRTRAMFHRFANELRRHIEVEEEMLIPVFEAHTGLHDIGPTLLIHREHREIERRLDHIRALLVATEVNLKAIEAMLFALRALLQDHDRREERVLYPACDRLFSNSERQALLDALSEEV